MKGGNTKQGNKGAAAPRGLPSPFGPSSPHPSEFPLSFVREAWWGEGGRGFMDNFWNYTHFSFV